jgi:hypothetical protein
MAKLNWYMKSNRKGTLIKFNCLWVIWQRIKSKFSKF